ncbi:hypothetical protein B217_02735 [Bifidobacterium bifidum IPLA 20015]|nr:hypothetical protein B217_02735 [Bifidobacterium bifidum IPLA 20015]
MIICPRFTPPLLNLICTLFPCNNSMATLTKQTVSKQKTSRLDIRLTDAQRQLIERAAELTGSTLTQWTARHLLESARKDIEEATVLHLESQAFEDFIQALDQPVPPAAEKLMERDPQWHDPLFPTSAQARPGRGNGEVLLWSTVHRQVGHTTRTVIGPAWDGRRVRVIHCVR